MHFDEITKYLNRYSFYEKMALCQVFSLKILDNFKLSFLDNLEHTILPWEIECFAELSILANKEYGKSTFSGSGIKRFNEIITVIRNYTHPHLESHIGKIEFANDFSMVTGLLQFKSQENMIHRLFRYDYIFNFENENVSVKNAFSEKFRISYSDFEELTISIIFFMSLPMFSKEIFRYLTNRFRNVVEMLTITRDDFIERQLQKNKNSIENSYYGFKYFSPYPFIEYKDTIYLPMPYLVVDAVTDSLFTRLTWENNRLRETIGKEVLQAYLYKILVDSNSYEEVVEEIKYSIGQRVIDSPDVMVRNNSTYILFDSKSSVPKLSLRQFDECDIEKTIGMHADNIIQLYKQINNFGFHYYPFSNRKDCERHNVFGVVVLLEDSYIPKQTLYEDVCSRLGCDIKSVEGKFISSNIKILSLHEIESYSFYSFSITASLQINRDNPDQWNDLTTLKSSNNSEEDAKKISPLFDYEKSIQDNLIKIKSEMEKQGLLRRGKNDDRQSNSQAARARILSACQRGKEYRAQKTPHGCE